ncbi:penicillin amidase [Janibacter sp. Soil728]|uniref:penicillin acylase family protein n=1 Tax=Janibacter sp. Soil728 TaxID=1736393 RepID=UPI0006F7B7D3|nr:penicillin acylase family protein [Janibacter sp. Soil728]KRE35975.1 penicillin amidase [Janibacter sp. Soil728]
MTLARQVRRSLYVTLALVIVLVVVLAGVVFGQGRRPLPQTAGTLEVSGLTGDVEVLRDAHGIPHIYADTMGDLMRAQGYVQAQDRFFEMDTRRHITAGRLAELVGEPGVETDKVIRTMGWRRVAEQELPMLEPKTRRALAAYTAGVNAWIDEQGSPSAMALEYTILSLSLPEYRVEPWTSVDSLAWLKAMAWDLRGNYTGELTRAALQGRVSDTMIAELYPAYPTAEHVPILSGKDWRPEGAKGAQAKGAQAKGAKPASSSTPAATPALLDTAAAIDAVPALLGRGDGIGSNSWVVSGERSTTGAPLLANDPHLGVGMPGIWYQMGLHCRQVDEACPLDVSGYTFAGVPGVVIGHNRDIAWGFTNLSPDVTDFYLEQITGDEYLRDGRLLPLETRTETIRVAGGPSQQITVRSTGHGPILSDAVPSVAAAGDEVEVEGRATSDYAVSLAWTALSPTTTADALLGLNTASNWDEFRAAAKDFAVPSQNLVYADTAGHIGYQAPGQVPIRKGVGDQPPGYVPAPGWDSTYDWKGFVPFDEMPTSLDPPEGLLVTANQQVTASTTPFLTTEWDSGYRSQRIHDLLESDDQVSPDKMARVQLDTDNGLAPALLGPLLEVELDDPFTEDARSLLRDWDGRQPSGAGEDAAAAMYFNAVWQRIVALTFNDDLPADLQASGGSQYWQAVTGLLAKPKSGWWDDRTTAGVVEGRDEILRRALVDARLDLTRELGKDPTTWRWDQLHQVTFRHQVLGGDAIPAPVRSLVNSGPHPVGGGSSTVDATGWDASQGFAVTSAPSMRMVVDLGDLDASRWVNQTGASGHPFSDHYDDQVDDWLAGRTHPWPSSEAAVREVTQQTLTLTPSAQ